MAFAINLPGVSFSEDLPTIRDFGALPEATPATLAKINDPSAPLKDYASGGTWVYSGTATGAKVPYYSNGKLVFPYTAGDTHRHEYTTPASITGLPMTLMALFKPTAAITQYLCWMGAAGPTLTLSSGTTLTFKITAGESYYGSVAIDTWQYIAMIVSSAGIVLQRNDMVETRTWAQLGGAPSPARPVAYKFGMPTIAPALAGELAMLGVWDGAITEAERVAAYRGVKAFAKRKGITLGTA